MPHRSALSVLGVLLLCGQVSAGKPLRAGGKAHRVTAQLLDYVGELHEKGDLEESGLHALKTLHVPVSAARARTSTAASVHRDALTKMLANPALDRQRVAAWADEKLRALAHVQLDRDEVRKGTLFTLMKFAPINTRPIKELDAKTKAELEAKDGSTFSISYMHYRTPAPFEVATHLVSQIQFQKVMGYNPSFHAGSWDLPVESLKHSDIEGFIAKLNTGDPNYRYHLTTLTEWLYLITNRGLAPGRWMGDFGDESVHEYAWTKKNAEGVTHEIGTKRPILIDKTPIFDLVGNVSQVLHAPSITFSKASFAIQMLSYQSENLTLMEQLGKDEVAWRNRGFRVSRRVKVGEPAAEKSREPLTR